MSNTRSSVLIALLVVATLALSVHAVEEPVLSKQQILDSSAPVPNRFSMEFSVSARGLEVVGL